MTETIDFGQFSRAVQVITVKKHRDQFEMCGKKYLFNSVRKNNRY